jgi:hypothetical protein
MLDFTFCRLHASYGRRRLLNRHRYGRRCFLNRLHCGCLMMSYGRLMKSSCHRRFCLKYFRCFLSVPTMICLYRSSDARMICWPTLN